MSIPATSVEPERGFSDLSWTSSKRRISLDWTTLDAILQIRYTLTNKYYLKPIPTGTTSLHFLGTTSIRSIAVEFNLLHYEVVRQRPLPGGRRDL